jgi:hypothetical protein
MARCVIRTYVEIADPEDVIGRVIGIDSWQRSLDVHAEHPALFERSLVQE